MLFATTKNINKTSFFVARGGVFYFKYIIMGVDYTGHYGLGFNVNLPEFEEDHEFFEDPIGFLDSICKETEFDYFEIGDGNYTGNSNNYYVVLDNPFSNGLDISENANKLKLFLTENNVSFDGEIDVVGGLEVW